MKRIVLIMAWCISIISYAEKMEQVKEGNLALPTSQQPGPLFLYGQNIIDKGDIQAELYLDVHKGKNKTFIDILPGVLIGFTDRFSLYCNIPFTPKYQYNCHHSSGIEDIFAQSEYAVFLQDKERCTNMVTLVGSLYVPTGSAKKNPHTGFGSPSFFLGATASHLSVEWYLIAAPAVWLTTTKKDTKFGNQFFYQGCIGHNIWSKSDKLIVTGMIELLGIYQQPDKIDGVTDPDSGSNLVHIGPTLWVSTQRFFGQAGILYVAARSYRGNQNKDNFLFALDLGWKFNA